MAHTRERLMPASTALDVTGGLEVIAPAKLNLAFEVLGRRSDGFHEIDTVMTTIDLVDTVRIIPAGALEVVFTGPAAAGIDPAEDLAGRAARALATAAGREPDVRIEVRKRIPLAAGLGGGSSDAAAVLRGLNQLWDLGWPADRLAALGATLGSDVAFFVHGGAAHCTGRGEAVAPLRDLKPPLRAVLVVPPVPPRPDKTARRYAGLTHADFSHQRRAWRLAQRISRGAPPPVADLVNAFEAVVERTEPELVAHYATYAAAGLPRLHLSGAGPSVYCFIPDNAKTAVLRRDLAALGPEVFEVRTLPRAQALAVRAIEA